MRKKMEAMISAAQDHICAALTELDGMSFREDRWSRPGGGGGRSRILQEGNVFEKAGVNISMVHGELSDEAARSMLSGTRIDGDRCFFAAGISLVLHPHNPFAPTAHANFRYFERGGEDAPAAWWFGGGADLTPSYLYEDDARHFHQTFKDICDRYDQAYYRKFKKWCDDYFRITHRNECRGVGGIFFDDLHDREPPILLSMVNDMAMAFPQAYVPIVARRKDIAFTEAQKRWQSVRRGRYVEFNLVYDRGTTFGLKTGGRVESILMSLPLVARWEYDHHPPEGSPEAKLVQVLKNPVDWI